jgi:hypothetical protein
MQECWCIATSLSQKTGPLSDNQHQCQTDPLVAQPRIVLVSGPAQTCPTTAPERSWVHSKICSVSTNTSARFSLPCEGMGQEVWLIAEFRSAETKYGRVVLVLVQPRIDATRTRAPSLQIHDDNLRRAVDAHRGCIHADSRGDEQMGSLDFEVTSVEAATKA